MIEYFEDFGLRWDIYTITCATLKVGFLERIELFFTIVLSPKSYRPADTSADCTEED